MCSVWPSHLFFLLQSVRSHLLSFSHSAWKVEQESEAEQSLKPALRALVSGRLGLEFCRMTNMLDFEQAIS